MVRGPWSGLYLIAVLVGATPVIDGVHEGHRVGGEQQGVDAVTRVLAAGGDVNERDSKGWTPLLSAALEGRPRILKLLLDKGAVAGLVAEDGQSALTVAAGCFISRRRAELAQGRGMPPEYVAYELAAPAVMVRELLAHGANANAADREGRTPLMLAAMQGWADSVRELLNAKADAKARDREGRSVLDYADPGGRAIVELLQKAGAAPATGRSGRTVCDAQRALKRQGYDTPIMDCLPGAQLRGVLSRFQKDHALEPTGDLDSSTRRALQIH